MNKFESCGECATHPFSNWLKKIRFMRVNGLFPSGDLQKDTSEMALGLELLQEYIQPPCECHLKIKQFVDMGTLQKERIKYSKFCEDSRKELEKTSSLVSPPRSIESSSSPSPSPSPSRSSKSRKSSSRD